MDVLFEKLFILISVFVLLLISTVDFNSTYRGCLGDSSGISVIVKLLFTSLLGVDLNFKGLNFFFVIASAGIAISHFQTIKLNLLFIRPYYNFKSMAEKSSEDSKTEEPEWKTKFNAKSI